MINNNNINFLTVKERIYQEDIISKERALETNCRRLKDVILNKTKAIFNKENELSIKTTMILENKKNHFEGNTHNSNSKNKSNLLLKTNNHCLRNKITMEHKQYTNQQRGNRHSNIATPTSRNGQNYKQIVDKSRLTQRRLFITNDKQVEKYTKCRIIEDNVLKNKCSIFPKQIDQSSPILSGSNRRIGSKLYLQNQSENHNTFSTEHSAQNVDIGVPIICSTFIKDDTMKENKNKNSCNKTKTDNDRNISHTTHTMNEVISMEMTEICDIQTGKVQDKNLKVNDCNEDRGKKIQKEEKSEVKSLNRKKNVTIQKLKDNHLNKLAVQNNISNALCANDAVNTCVPLQVSTKYEEHAVTTKMHNTLQAQKSDNKIQSKKESILLLSDNTNSTNSNIQSSLNVNTSLDVIVKTNKVTSNQSFRTINNKKSIVLNNQCESINSTQTSLQMNTSIDSIRKTRLRRNNCSIKQSFSQEKNIKDLRKNHSYRDNQYLTIENKETDNDFLENINLFERLKNISTQNQFSHKVQSNICEMRDKERVGNDKSNNLISLKYHFNDHTGNSDNNYSCIEESPYTISPIDNKENKNKTKSDVL